MELSEATLGLLRDEAYVFLCREAVQERLDALEQEKAAIASTRPPFGVLARKETRDAFAHSMRTALDSETALRERLAQITRLEDWLHPKIRTDLVIYLDAASPDYRRFPQIQHLLDTWADAAQPLPDLLVAFARDMRVLREAAATAKPGHRQCAHELAMLRDIAERVETKYEELRRIDLTVADHTTHLSAQDVRMPTLPDLRRVDWVTRLGIMPLEQLIPEVQRVESEIRAFSNGGHETALARLQASRELCTQLQENFLLHYWSQLRAHAQAHYVEERDLDEVLATLAQQHINAEVVRRQKAITHDPFTSER